MQRDWYIAAIVLLIAGIILIVAAIIWRLTMSGLPTSNQNPQGPIWLGIGGIILIIVAVICFFVGRFGSGPRRIETEWGIEYV